MSSESDTKWDYIVVGGGSAGCAVASRLSENAATRVLLLDAGRSDAHLFSRIPAAIGFAIESPAMNWHYTASADTSRGDRVDMWPAGRLLGGGSAINGMMFVRGNPRDYDRWEALGNPGWGYDGVLPYFRKLENNERGADEYRGVGGPVAVSDVRIKSELTDAFVDGMVELGLVRNPDLNGATQDGVDYCQVMQHRGFRQSTAKAYLSPARGRANLKIELEARVDRIGIKNAVARHVEYLRDGRQHRAVASRGIVICAGAIASPKLLLLSGIGDARSLGELGIDVVRDLPGVGSNLQEHPGVILSAHVTRRTLTSDRNPLRALMHGANYILRGRGPLSNPVGHAQAFVRTRDGLDAPNVQVIFSPLSYDHHEGGATPYTKPAINLAVGLCHVGSRGRISIASTDPAAYPVIDYSLLDDDDDVQQLLEGIRFARRLYETRAFAGYFKDERKPGKEFESDDKLIDCIRQQSFLMYHPCGTCKMGQDEDAVVDPNLRVHGVGNLWVADASVFPTITSGNINATAIMVGEKAADLIKENEGQT
jgi:choline dehydrogenase